jgi:putative chitinase
MEIYAAAKKLGAPTAVAAALHEAGARFHVRYTDHFVAQVYVESAGFVRTRENLSYTPERLLEVFFGRNGMTTIEQARAVVARGHASIAEQVYGGEWGARNLGNVLFGDAWDFIGRGYKQLTGRGNYTAYSLGVYGDKRVLFNPPLLERLPDSALSAAWFWHWRGIDMLPDNIRTITRRVNGGLNGLSERQRALDRIRR